MYWKLYAVENTLRILIHSVLSVQIDPNWWDAAVDPGIRKRAERFRQDYTKRASHTMPGGHGIYYVFLSDLNNIIRANSNLLLPVIPDIDNWVVKIEAIRLPRNLVGHMNFPGQRDREVIDRVYADMPALIAQLRGYGLPVQIP
jgi:hypothetical protein